MYFSIVMQQDYIEIIADYSILYLSASFFGATVQ